MTIDASGNIFGTTTLGGANNMGTVFEVSSGSNTITALAIFDGDNGANPNGGVTLDSGGNIYGTTLSGGASSVGTVYELVRASGSASAPEPRAIMLLLPGVAASGFRSISLRRRNDK